jgi:hypothetical protein
MNSCGKFAEKEGEQELILLRITLTNTKGPNKVVKIYFTSN